MFISFDNKPSIHWTCCDYSGAQKQCTNAIMVTIAWDLWALAFHRHDGRPLLTFFFFHAMLLSYLFNTAGCCMAFGIRSKDILQKNRRIKLKKIYIYLLVEKITCWSYFTFPYIFRFNTIKWMWKWQKWPNENTILYSTCVSEKK